MKWVVPYRIGGPFHLSDVAALQANIRRFYNPDEVQFIVYSDDPRAGDFCDRWHPLEADWSQGRWSVQECFREPGPVFFTGLDTVLLDRIDCMFRLVEGLQEDEFLMMKPFNRERARLGKSASGVMGWTGDFSWLYREFPWRTIDFSTREQNRTETALRERGIRIHHVQDFCDGVFSYKKHWRDGIREGVRLLVFHGTPRPGQVRDAEIRRLRGAHETAD